MFKCKTNNKGELIAERKLERTCTWVFWADSFRITKLGSDQDALRWCLDKLGTGQWNSARPEKEMSCETEKRHGGSEMRTAEWPKPTREGCTPEDSNSESGLSSLVVRETRIKTTLNYRSSLTTIAKLQKFRNTLNFSEHTLFLTPWENGSPHTPPAGASAVRPAAVQARSAPRPCLHAHKMTHVQACIWSRVCKRL